MHAGDVELATDTASGRLSGSKMYVAFAGQASHFLVAAKDEGKLALFLVPASRPGVTATALPNIARAPLYRVDFDLPLAELARVGDGDGAAIFDETIARAAVLDRKSTRLNSSQ